MTRFDYVEYLCGPRGCGREDLLRAVVYIEQGSACVSFMSTRSGRWVSGEPIWKAVRRGADIASSDALYVGSPAKCKEAGTEPVWLDLVTLDIDLKPPPIVVERDGGRFVIRDRATGEEVKRVSESRLKTAVKEVARMYKMPPIEVFDAMYWGGGEYPAWEYVMRKARRVMQTLRRLGADAMFVYSGAKGFHVKLVLPRLYHADLRPALARGLAQLLDVEVDRQTLDIRRKLRVPYTINTKTGQDAFIFDPATGEKIKELRWPKPVDSAFVGFLIQQPPRLAKPTALEPVRRKTSWVFILEEVAARNPMLREDCRKRFSALFGCACAVDGLGSNACVSRLAAALGMGELPRAYAYAAERGYKVCAKRLAEGQKPLFSIKKALSGENVWYSIRECITAKPPAEVGKELDAADEGQEAEPAAVQIEPLPTEEAKPAEAPPEAPLAAEEHAETDKPNVEEKVPLAVAPAAAVLGAVGMQLQAPVQNWPAAPPLSATVQTEFSHPAEAAESRKLDSAEACLANPICTAKLKRCIWIHLKVPKEEKKAAAKAEFESRGELFAYCLKDAVEYARRVAGS
jgi:hypothetical protein